MTLVILSNLQINMQHDMWYVTIQTWFCKRFCLYESKGDPNFAYGEFKGFCVAIYNKTQVTVIWEISPRAGIDCYWIGEFLVCPEAYKYVDLFLRNSVLLCMCQFL